jgi:hypothetical protein
MSSTSVQVEGIEVAIRAMTAQMYAQTHAIVAAKMRDIYHSAHARWPVDRRTQRRTYAHSRDQLQLADESDGRSRVKVEIRNGAKQAQGIHYVYFIRSYQNNLKGASAWVELVRKPVRVAVKDVSETIVGASRV